MSDLLEAAADSLGLPSALVQRSAAARAAETSSSVDDILTVWAGGDAVAITPSEPAPEPEPAAESAEPVGVTDLEPEPAQTSVATIAPPEAPSGVEVPAPQPEPEEPLEPVALATRVRTAMRVGAWAGAALGLVGFLMASAMWAPNAAAVPDSGPVVQVKAISILIGVALVSIVFGALVASLSRAATAWRDPAMQLSGSKTATLWIGVIVGLALGVVGGGVLANGFATQIPNSEGLVQLPVLATLAVLLIGGGVLGALTAIVPQLLGTPVAVSEEDADEIDEVKTRLGNAVSIPLAAAVLLVLLVVPFGYMLIQSNHLGDNGAAIVAILTAAGILGFASLAGTKPEMRISFGELMVAVLGIGTVLLIILAVLFYTGRDDHPADTGGEEAAIISVV